MNKRPILYLILLSLFLILGIAFLWLPKYQAFNDLQLEIKEKKEKLQNKEEYFLQLERLSERLKGYSSELAKINSGLPSSPDISNFFNFINNNASQNGLILEKTDLGKTIPLKEESPIKQTQLSFSLSGSYPAFKNFLLSLQNSSRLIGVEEISFKSSKAEEEKAGETFSFDLKVKIHSY